MFTFLSAVIAKRVSFDPSGHEPAILGMPAQMYCMLVWLLLFLTFLWEPWITVFQNSKEVSCGTKGYKDGACGSNDAVRQEPCGNRHFL